MWEVEYTHEFGDWYASLPEEDQDAVIARVELLEELGPALGRPTVDSIHQSRHPNMKELRSQAECGFSSRSTLGAPQFC